MPKSCVNCVWFVYTLGDRGYSEYTPGWDFSMSCGKNVWDFDSFETTEEEHCRNMLTANTCEHYELSALAESCGATE